MKTYQTLSLIGCILGILMSLFWWALLGVGTIANDVSLNLTKQYGNSSQLAQTQQTHTGNQNFFNNSISGMVLAFFIFIALIPLTFVVRKRTKALGIILLVFGVIAVAITNLWGIVPFALLLPAGILAIRDKRQPTVQPQP